MLAGILYGVAGLVGKFAEINLVSVGSATQHADISASAKHTYLP